MTIHTFETSSQLNNEKFYKIQEELKTKDKSKWTKEKKGMFYWGLKNQGILIRMLQIKKKGYYSYSILYLISARRVMENDNYVGLFDTENYDILEEKVNTLLKKKSSSLPKLNKCNLRRLDFCINAELNNQEEVKAYIKTATRAKIPSKLERKMAYDVKSKRVKPFKDDMTVYSSEYIEVSIYNKLRQMKKEEKDIYSAKDFTEAENIVRIEIRCMEGKIQALKDKYKIQTISDFMSYANIIGNDLYHYYLTKMFGKGEIYTLKEAINRIEMSGFKPENIETMKEFITEANSSRSVAEAVKLYRNLFGKKETKRILFMFDCIGTNYVTVANTDVKLFKDRYVPTPIELFEICFDKNNNI